MSYPDIPNWITMRFDTDELNSLDNEFNLFYDAGIERGREIGYQDGYDNGYDTGYDNGADAGYDGR